MRGYTTIDLDVDPPPDVIIEIDLSHPSLDTFPIYAALGVPDVWRYAGQQVYISHRTADAYTAVPSSAVLPEVTSVHLTQWVQTGRELPRLAWIRRVRAWAASLTATP